MDNNFYASFINRIEEDAFKTADFPVTSITEEQAHVYVRDFLETLYIIGLYHTRREMGFQSTSLNDVLCFPDLRQDFGFSADSAEDCEEFACSYLKILMSTPRYTKNCGGYDFFADNFEEEGCEQEYLQKFLEAALLYFSQRINKCRVDYLEILFGILYSLTAKILYHTCYGVFRELSPTL